MRIEDVQLGQVAGDLRALRDRVIGNVATFTPLNWLEPGAESGIQALCATDAGSINLDFLPSIDPDYSLQNYDLMIHYQDIHGRARHTKIRIGKDGVEIVSRG